MCVYVTYDGGGPSQCVSCQGGLHKNWSDNHWGDPGLKLDRFNHYTTVLYVAVLRKQLIWGQKYHLWLFAWKLIFGSWNHQRYIPLWQKMQKSAGKWSKNTFLHFLTLWPKRFGQFSPFMCAILRVFQPCGQLHMWSNLWISVTQEVFSQF